VGGFHAVNISLQMKHRELEANLERQQARIAIETGGEIEPRLGTVLPGDPALLRGIPVVGVAGGFGGAIPGTRPDSAR
jgi:hypothetical protein